MKQKKEPIAMVLGNIPFSRAELKEVESQNPKYKLFNTQPNRRTRREKLNAGRILNNRKKTKGRRGNAVLIRMARFSLKLHALRTRIVTV